MRRVLSFLIGVLIGGIMGTIVALLFAPSSGNVLCDQINSRMQGLITDVQHAASTRRIELEERLETLRAPRE
jgi:gas vesicle protein